MQKNESELTGVNRKATAAEVRAESVQRLYFVDNGAGAIKIGISHDIPARLRALQSASPTKLTLLLAYPGTEWDERELHHMFRDLRLEGEWFRDAPIIQAYLQHVLDIADLARSTIDWHVKNRIPLNRAGVKIGPFEPHPA